MRFSLRTLLIFMLLAGPIVAFGWIRWRERHEIQRELERIELELRAGEERFSGVVDRFTALPSAAEE
jgi:hypothetical protein